MEFQTIHTHIIKRYGYLNVKNRTVIWDINNFKALTVIFLMFLVGLVYGQKTENASANAFGDETKMANFNHPQLTFGKNIVGTIDIFDNILMMDSVSFEINYNSKYKPRLLAKSFMDLKKVNLKTVRYDDRNSTITVKMYNMQHINNGNATHFYGFYMDKSIEKGSARLTIYADNGKKYQSDFSPIRIIPVSNKN